MPINTKTTDSSTANSEIVDNNQEIKFDLSDEGIWISTEKGKIPVYFNPNRFRSLEVPILLSDTTKINKLGFKVENDLSSIVKDQLNYYLEYEYKATS